MLPAARFAPLARSLLAAATVCGGVLGSVATSEADPTIYASTSTKPFQLADEPVERQLRVKLHSVGALSHTASIRAVSTENNPQSLDYQLEVIRLDREPEVANGATLGESASVTIDLEPECVEDVCDLDEVLLVRVTRLGNVGGDAGGLAIEASGAMEYADFESMGDSDTLELLIDDPSVTEDEEAADDDGPSQ